MFDLKSTIDWCESNYIVSNYIAEYWNTLSGLCIILSGVFFKFNNNEWLNNNIKYELNFNNICNYLILVGVGTMLFHGTLLYPFQLLDELPMLLVANEYIKLLTRLRMSNMIFSYKSIVYFKNITQYIYIPLLFISSIYFIHPNLQIVTFHITLKIVEGSLLFILYNLSKSLNKIAYYQICDKDKMENKFETEKIQNICSFSLIDDGRRVKAVSKNNILKKEQENIKQYIIKRGELKKVTQISLYLYSTSLFLWVLENLFCEYVSKYAQLHAIWHLLSSIGIYYLNNIMQKYVELDKIIFKN